MAHNNRIPYGPRVAVDCYGRPKLQLLPDDLICCGPSWVHLSISFSRNKAPQKQFSTIAGCFSVTTVDTARAFDVLDHSDKCLDTERRSTLPENVSIHRAT